MRKIMVGLALLLATSLVAAFTNADAHMGGGGMGMGQGYGSSNQGGSAYGPNGNGGYDMGGGMMGGGMMGGGYGSGMMGGMGMGGYGPGMMMGGGYGSGPYRQYDNGRQQQLRQPINRAQARSMVENYLQSTGNPNLKLGDIKDEGPYFEADIVTKDNSLVDKLMVDKNTGTMRSLY